MTSISKAIILVAGRGTRMGRYTEDIPKCLLPLGDSVLLDYQLKAIEAAGIKEVVLSAGFGVDKIERFLEDWSGSIEVIVEYNPFYDISNNLVSLWNVRHRLKGGFVLTNGDNLFEASVIEKIAAAPGNIVLGARRKTNYDDDDMKIALDELGHVRAVNKSMGTEDIGAESIGVIKFSAVGAEFMASQLDRMVRETEGLQSYYLRAIELLIGCVDWPIQIADIGSMKWMEIDYPTDYEIAQQTYKEYANFQLESASKIVL